MVSKRLAKIVGTGVLIKFLLGIPLKAHCPIPKNLHLSKYQNKIIQKDASLPQQNLNLEKISFPYEEKHFADDTYVISNCKYVLGDSL